MLFLREILLLAVILCVCWETGDNCGVECDESQRGLAQPTCYLRHYGTSTDCVISVRITDSAIRALGSFDKLTLMLDLQTRVNKLRIDDYFSNQLKVSTFRFHRGITSLILQGHYINIHINPGMFSLLPNLEYLAVISVLFEYFPYFGYFNRFLTYLYISEFDIPSTTLNILTGGHVSGLTGLKYLYLSPSQYMKRTDQSFTGLTSLTYLHLGSFHIPNPVTTLSPLVRLRDLRLQNCRFTDISFLTRTPYLYGLTRLDLNDNLITRIQCGAFTGLNNLKYLYLSSNPIQNICLTAFKGLESLVGLYLRYTSLTSPSSRMFEYLPSLEYIEIYGTLLHCDCCLLWLSRVHHNFDLYIDYARCASPSQHIRKRATDLSIYRYCTQDLSYQCFNRSISCPSGTSCQDTLDTYLCVCQQEGDLFDRSLNRCVSREEISSARPKLDGTTSTFATFPAATCPSCPSCPTSTCATCPTTAAPTI